MKPIRIMKGFIADLTMLRFVRKSLAEAGAIG